MQSTLRTAVLLIQALVMVAFSGGSSALAADTPEIGVHEERVGAGTVVYRLPGAGTLHRVRVELYDATNPGLPRRADWRVQIFHVTRGASATVVAPMAQLSAADPDLQLPRPFGVRFDADDSLLIVATLAADDSARGVLLQVSFEYESKERSVSRLPVLSLSSQRTEGSSSGRWSLRPAVAGRLVAISGRLLACAEEIVLEDTASGRVIWRTRVAEPFTGRDADQRSEVVRPGVAVEAGRTYELRAVRSGAEKGCGEGAPHAMMVPR